MTGLVRNASGRLIHRAECQYAKGQYMHPWDWAIGKEPSFLLDACYGFGYRPCWHCQPFKEKK